MVIYKFRLLIIILFDSSTWWTYISFCLTSWGKVDFLGQGDIVSSWVIRPKESFDDRNLTSSVLKFLQYFPKN